MLHSDIEQIETTPVETPEEETKGEGSGMRKELYSGPSRLEANLGLRESRREIRNRIKSYGRKGTDLGP